MGAMTLIWTTLPAGLRRGSDGEWIAKISVFLSPRLEADGDAKSLAAFPEFLDWPETLRSLPADGIEFAVQTSDGSKVVSEQTMLPLKATGPGDKPDSAAWQAIFAADMPVRALEALPDRKAAMPMTTYPAGRLVDEIRALYTQALTDSVGERAGPTDLKTFAGPSGTSALDEFTHFHAGSADPAPRTFTTQADERPGFHEVVGGLGTYPRLLRKLGLVLDLELRATELGLVPGRHGQRLRAYPVNASFDSTEHHRHWTAVEYSDSDGVFRAAPATGLMSTPSLALDSSATTIVQEKYEHVAFKIAHELKQSASASEPTGEFELPAMLQGGMRVAHSHAPAIVETAMAGQAKLDRSLRDSMQNRKSGLLGADADGLDEEPLHVDQLMRGFRVDVRDLHEGQWRSLCRRRGEYLAGDWAWTDGDGGVEDEGTIEPLVYEDANAIDTGKRVTEDLFEWDGWSLVVPRDDTATSAAAKNQEKFAADAGSPLEVTLKVPSGSLQPQRFGRCYQFRIRNVDLAGNSLTLEEANALEETQSSATTATRPTCCLRVESVKPPVVFRAQPRGPNESGDVIVIRDADSSDYRNGSFRLHVLPPEVPLRIAEKHGVFDKLGAEQSWQLIKNHRGKLEVDDDGNAREAIPDRNYYTPYLPDPLARQAVMILPDGGGVVDLPRFDDVPRRLRGHELARSCTLVVKPGQHRVEASVSGREVTLGIPRGRAHTIRLAAKLSAEDLELMAMAHPDWHSDEGLSSPGVLHSMAERAARGELELLAPAESVTFVYATQRPMQAPEFGRPLVLAREPASTVVRLADDALGFDRPSTGRVDIYARWEDPVDDPGEDGWTVVTNEMHAGGVRIDEDNDTKPFDPAELDEPKRSPLAHDFNDTRYREVQYQAVAASRFATFYPASLTADPDNITLASAPVTLKVPSTAPPDAPDVAYVIPTFGRREPGAHDARAERTTIVSGDGLRIYMNRGWFSSGKDEQLALVLSADTDDVSGLVSEWGVNPLRDSAPLPPLRLQHVWGGADKIEHWQHGDDSVALALFDVQFSDEHGMPFVDIEFLSQRAFMPLVRLALARFQEHSIDGCHLSPIVRADFVPLTPGRALTVRKTSRNTWHIVARGYSYQTEDVQQPTSIVRAHIEVMPRNASAESLAWQPVGNSVILGAAAEEPWHFEWSGEIQVRDSDHLSLMWRRRLVVQEFEPFDAADAASPELDDRSRLISSHTLDV